MTIIGFYMMYFVGAIAFVMLLTGCEIDFRLTLKDTKKQKEEEQIDDTNYPS